MKRLIFVMPSNVNKVNYFGCFFTLRNGTIVKRKLELSDTLEKNPKSTLVVINIGQGTLNIWFQNFQLMTLTFSFKVEENRELGTIKPHTNFELFNCLLLVSHLINEVK